MRVTSGSHDLCGTHRGGLRDRRSGQPHVPCEEAVQQSVEQIAGKKVPFVKCEPCDPVEVKELFRNYPNIDAAVWIPLLRALASGCGRECCEAA
ncbi:MAG: hypothetical protein ACLTSG_08550 [Lachnospiraceae bacterium]